jgi:DNA-directed RNA polymerase subunit K
MAEEKIDFTRYEVARILGARALQIAMDAPLLLKISDEELREMRFDALKIANKEFNSGVLPISVKRPMPKKIEEKLKAAREDKVDDAKIIEKEKEEEKEIAESAKEMGFEDPDADESSDEESSGNGE